MERKYFFGWSNFKWFISELSKTLTSQPSYFSKKRIESFIAFTIGQFGMVYYLLQKMQSMTMSDMLMWAGVEFAIAGWMVSQIQKQKSLYTDNHIDINIDDEKQINS